MTENKEQSYSRVIYQNQDDRTAQDLVNSYKYGYQAQSKKAWSPNIQKEETFRKKRKREDAYIEQFHPMDRPVLLIKEKHQYQAQNKDNVLNDKEKEEYYKISENTNMVSDIGDEIKFLEKQIRRKTRVHNKTNQIQDPDNISSVYKIDGIEFLPEGFIELDPLLLKDEYEFESQVYEQLFSEEQRKIKVLRRKQYDQRNKQKMREVSIFLLDEHKNKILEFLERWYFKNKRKLNDKEIGYVSNLFQIDPSDVERLQEAFLRQKKLNNLRSLNQYLQDKNSSMPQYMNRVLKGKNEYRDVTPKYMQPVSTYEPVILNKYKPKYVNSKTMRSQRPQNNTQNQNQTEQLDSTIKTKSQIRDELNKSQLNKSQLNQTVGGNQSKIEAKKPDMSQFANAFEDLMYQDQKVQGEKHDPMNEESIEMYNNNPNYETDVKMYFDSEINAILDNVKGYQPLIKKTEGQVDEKYDSNSFVNSFKDKLLQSQEDITDMEKNLLDYDKNPNEYKNRMNMGDLLELENIVNDIRTDINSKRITIAGKNKNGEIFVLQKLHPIKIGECYYYQQIQDKTENGNRKVVLVTKNEQGQILDEYNIPEKYWSNYYENEVRECVPEFLGDDAKELVLKNKKGKIIHVIKIRPTQSHLIVDHFNKQFELGDFRRATMVESPTDKEHILNLVKFQDQIYMTKINESKNPKNQTAQIQSEVFMVPQNECILSQKIPTKFLSDSYHQEVQYNKDLKANQLLIKNKEGKICCKLDLKEKPKAIEYRKDSLVENPDQLKIMNFNEIVEISDPDGKSLATALNIQIGSSEYKNYKIRPTLVGQDYYTQTINEIVNKDGKKKLTLITQNEVGEIISKEEFDSDLISDKYYNRIVEETIDGLGQKTVVLETLNERGQSISRQTLKPELSPEFSQYYDGIVEELVNEKDQKRVSVLKPTQQNRISVLQEIPEEIEEEHQFSNLMQNDSKEESSQEKEQDEEKDLIGYYEDLLNKYGKKQDKRGSLSQKKSSFQTRPKGHTIQLKDRERKKQEPIVLERPRNYSGRKVNLFYPQKTKVSEEDDQEVSYQDFQNKRKSSRTKKKSIDKDEQKRKSSRKTSTNKTPDKKSILQKLFEEKNIDYRQTEDLNGLQKHPGKKNTMNVRDVERPQLEDSMEYQQDVYVVKSNVDPENEERTQTQQFVKNVKTQIAPDTRVLTEDEIIQRKDQKDYNKEMLDQLKNVDGIERRQQLGEYESEDNDEVQELTESKKKIRDQLMDSQQEDFRNSNEQQDDEMVSVEQSEQEQEKKISNLVSDIKHDDNDDGVDMNYSNDIKNSKKQSLNDQKQSQLSSKNKLSQKQDKNSIIDSELQNIPSQQIESEKNIDKNQSEQQFKKPKKNKLSQQKLSKVGILQQKQKPKKFSKVLGDKKNSVTKDKKKSIDKQKIPKSQPTNEEMMSMIQEFINNNPDEKEKLKNIILDQDKEKKTKQGPQDLLDEYFEFYDGFDTDEDYKEKMMFTSLFYFYLKQKGIEAQIIQNLQFKINFLFYKQKFYFNQIINVKNVLWRIFYEQKIYSILNRIFVIIKRQKGQINYCYQLWNFFNS